MAIKIGANFRINCLSNKIRKKSIFYPYDAHEMKRAKLRGCVCMSGSNKWTDWFMLKYTSVVDLMLLYLIPCFCSSMSVASRWLTTCTVSLIYNEAKLVLSMTLKCFSLCSQGPSLAAHEGYRPRLVSSLYYLFIM